MQVQTSSSEFVANIIAFLEKNGTRKSGQDSAGNWSSLSAQVETFELHLSETVCGVPDGYLFISEAGDDLYVGTLDDVEIDEAGDWHERLAGLIERV